MGNLSNIKFTTIICDTEVFRCHIKLISLPNMPFRWLRDIRSMLYKLHYYFKMDCLSVICLAASNGKQVLAARCLIFFLTKTVKEWVRCPKRFTSLSGIKSWIMSLEYLEDLGTWSRYQICLLQEIKKEAESLLNIFLTDTAIL